MGRRAPLEGLTPARLRQLQRARILDALVAAGAERGYVGLSVGEIVARGGLSRKTFYALFRTREEAFFAAADALMDRAIRRMGAACARSGSADERVAAALCELLALLEEEPGAARLAAEAPAITALAGHGDRPLDRLAHWLASVQRELALEPAIPASEQLAVVVSLVHTRFEHDLAPDDDFLHALLRVVMSPAPIKRFSRGDFAPGGGDPRRLELAHAALRERDSERLWQVLVDATCDHDRATVAALADRAEGPLALLAGAALEGGAHGVLRSAGAAVSGGRLPARAARLLQIVVEQPGLSGTELAAAMHIRHRSQLSRLVAQLENQGLVVHARIDGRTKRWHPTDAGYAWLRPRRHAA